jgi:hypothetical protein
MTKYFLAMLTVLIPIIAYRLIVLVPVYLLVSYKGHSALLISGPHFTLIGACGD